MEPGSDRGTWGEVQRGDLPARIAAAAPGCAWVASVCTGAMLLSAAGLTRGRPATTHHVAHADLAAAGAQLITDARVVDDGDLLTAGGITSGLDLRSGSSSERREPRSRPKSPVRWSTSARMLFGPASARSERAPAAALTTGSR